MNPTAPIVKICGITRPQDGLLALEHGADWLGFIRWSGSARYQPPGQAAATLLAVRTGARRLFQAVGVYVDAELDVIVREFHLIGFDRIQLHGSEPPEFVAALRARLPVPLIKVLKIQSAASLMAAQAYPGVDLLTDTHHPALPGGTGQGYDYELLRGLTAERRVLVAGGLTPENVAAVVGSLRPFGVDVSSGVEAAPGVKDPAKVAAFLAAVRA